MAMDLNSSFLFEGWSIHYSILSSAPAGQASPRKAVLFVHGTPWSSAVFQPTIEALLARGSYHILVYDLPGYGKSQRFDASAAKTSSMSSFLGDTSVKFQATALQALLEHVNSDTSDRLIDLNVIAHDIAGAIVLRTHLIHGYKFSSMMFVDTNTVLPWGDGFYKLARSTPDVFLKLPPNIHEAVVRAVVQSASYKPNNLKPYWEDVLAKPWIDNQQEANRSSERQHSFVRQIAQANDTDVEEMLSGNMYEKVICKVKIMWGEQDRWIPKHKIDEFVARLKSTTVETSFIPNAGHLIMLDQPERFAEEVLDWLR